ncbi:cell wall hydrolase [Paracoccus benzoatiresistens]|uniref:Cell wall hydrolase n=1 Tax=Paracoccus benzoatiresistens TaxID=2997341 RepID=A0ABT4J9K9_9RHOB|nr:cell wall hydrolase [Paracoccus sp. EF6]MCZ0963816.1 cell wall hydrolase [Paracoccus sp. EF6]
MIREVLVMAIALVAAWHSSALVFVRVDENQFRQPVSALQARRSLASSGPTLPIQPTLPAVRAETWGTTFGPAVPAPVLSDLALDSAAAPVWRPDKVATARPLPRPATADQILRGARIPLPPASLRNASDLSCIAVAIYHEARDQDDFGQRAVASVILQRMALPGRWGGTACDIVAPRQFSFLTSRHDYPPIEDMAAWAKAVRFAARALIEGPMPELEGADHYHTTAVTPDWATSMVRVRLIDDHVFYADPRSSAL